MNSKSDPDKTDIFSKTKRSDIMSRVKYKNTKPEILIRKELILWKKLFKNKNDLKIYIF
jgi:G:T-mismatch repair DNA endonuclease (very short patch repair protein)